MHPIKCMAWQIVDLVGDSRDLWLEAATELNPESKNGDIGSIHSKVRRLQNNLLSRKMAHPYSRAQTARIDKYSNLHGPGLI